MNRSPLYNPPFTGRSREIKVFRSVLADLAETGTGCCVLIRGLPGTGKTRLLAEFGALAQSRNMTVLSVSLSPSMRQKPYGIIAALLDAYLARVSVYPAQKRAGLREALSRGAEEIIPVVVRLHPGYASIFPSERSASGDSSLQPADGERVPELLRVFLSNLALFEQGVVITLDDAHYCDPESLHMLEASVPFFGTMSLVLAASYHQNMTESGRRRYPGLFGGGEVVELQTEPLDEESHLGFCAGLLGADEHSARDIASFVFDATGGNPLFSHESILYLLNRGALSVSGGNVSFDRTTAPSLYQFDSYAAAAARNAGYLSETQTEILRVLAVLGMTFTPERAAEFLPRCVPGLNGHLDAALDAARILDFISFSNGVYRWNHAGVRDSFYAAADPDMRRALHRDIARSLKDRTSGDPELLFDAAYHFMRCDADDESLAFAYAAGETALDMFALDSADEFFSFCVSDAAARLRSPLVFRAKVMLCAICLARGSTAEAITRLEELLPQAPAQEAVDVYRFLSLAYYRTGDLARCEDLTRQGLRLLGDDLPHFASPAIALQSARLLTARLFRRRARVTGAQIRRARALSSLWENIARLYVSRDLLRFIHAALKVRTAAASDFRGASASGDMILAGAFMALRRFGAALRYLQAGLSALGSSGSEWESAQIGHLMGTLWLWRGKPSEAERSLLESLRRFTAMGDVSARCAVLFPLTELYIGTARYDDARRAAKEGYELSSAAQNHFACSRSAGQLAIIEAELGDVDAAHGWLEAAADADAKANSGPCSFFLHYSESVVYLRSGEYARSLDSAGAARRIMRRSRIAGFYAAGVLPVEIEAAARGSLRAGGRLRRFMSALRYYPWQSRRPELFYALGTAAHARGRRSLAARFCRAAAAGAQRSGRTRLEARAFSCLADVRLSRSLKDALELYEKAFLLCEECGALRDADRVLSRIIEAGAGEAVIGRLTAPRRLSLLLAAKRLQSAESNEKLLELAADFFRAEAGGIYVAGEEIFPLEKAASRGSTDEPLARLARDVYMNEEVICTGLMIGFPLPSAGKVVGALCLQGCSPLIALGCMVEAVSAAIASSSPGVISDEPSPQRAGKKTFVSSDDSRMNTVLDYIRKNYRDDISREGLASLVGLHPDNLGKMFKMRTGKKIGDFINSLRIEEAMGLLSGTDTPVIDIAFAAGFESLRTFNRSFAAFAGVTPTAYREMVKKRKKR